MLPKRGSNGDDRFRLASLIGTIQPEVVMVRETSPGPLGGIAGLSSGRRMLECWPERLKVKG